MRKALIIIDVQNDFLPNGALAVPNGDAVIPVINKLVEHEMFDVIVASQDWHPAIHLSFASNNKGTTPYQIIDFEGYPQTMWPDHCIQGTIGAQLSDALNWNKVAAIFRKGMNPLIDSYSAFYDNHHLDNTGLEGYLTSKEIEAVYICGLAGDYCVYFSALDALELGFETYIIDDAVRSINDVDYISKMEFFKQQGGYVIESSTL